MAKVEVGVLIMDRWTLSRLRNRRHGRRSTIVTSQLPLDKWARRYR
jgi:hypothetical protein